MRTPPRPKPLRSALFALTGFGNAALTALSRANLTPDFVVTRAEPGCFPHYDEEPLPALAHGSACPASWISKARLCCGAAIWMSSLSRLIIASSRRRSWTASPGPSICIRLCCPATRGPNPFYWVIRNGEARTGVTAHFLTPAIDAGEVLWSESLDVAIDETQGSLRRRLALLAGRGAVSVVTDVAKDAVTNATTE